ncbi:hypothetical protein SH449x_002937 [Pirellulaceae bacterium SH449]
MDCISRLLNVEVPCGTIEPYQRRTLTDDDTSAVRTTALTPSGRTRAPLTCGCIQRVDPWVLGGPSSPLDVTDPFRSLQKGLVSDDSELIGNENGWPALIAGPPLMLVYFAFPFAVTALGFFVIYAFSVWVTNAVASP